MPVSVRVSQEGFFPYARLLFEAHQAMRSPKPRMVKVHGVSKAPEGFGLDPEEIDNFNSSPNKTGETDMNDMEIDDSRL